MSGTVLFIQGGGDDAHEWDEKIADRLRKELGDGTPIAFPLIEGLDRLDWAATKTALSTEFGKLPPGAVVVAHSVGAAAVIKLLAEGVDPRLAQLFLLAPPYNGADGEWGDSDFAFPANFAKRLPKKLPVTIWHSEDDDTIPVDSAHRYAEKLPEAKVVIVDGYGHQFEKSLKFLADAIRGALP